MIEPTRVTSVDLRITETRPPRIALTLTGDHGRISAYTLDSWTAMELADAMMRHALQLDPTIAAELRRRLRA